MQQVARNSLISAANVTCGSKMTSCRLETKPCGYRLLLVFKVFEVQRIHKVSKGAQFALIYLLAILAAFVHIVRQTQDLRLDVAIGADASAIHHHLVHVNWCLQPHRQGNGIARTGIDFDRAAADIDIY